MCFLQWQSGGHAPDIVNVSGIQDRTNQIYYENVGMTDFLIKIVIDLLRVKFCLYVRDFLWRFYENYCTNFSCLAGVNEGWNFSQPIFTLHITISVETWRASWTSFGTVKYCNHKINFFQIYRNIETILRSYRS